MKKEKCFKKIKKFFPPVEFILGVLNIVFFWIVGLLTPRTNSYCELIFFICLTIIFAINFLYFLFKLGEDLI